MEEKKVLNESSGCPVQHGKPSKQNKEEDMKMPVDKLCSSETINERNYLPNDVANNDKAQQPWPGQRKTLGTSRVVSLIPKASDDKLKESNEPTTTENKTDEHWVYPSEQQFFNALKRKGWKGTQEQDMSSVVAIHNRVNDRVWEKILEYEELHCNTCKTPKLLKFQGRPRDLSPKARFFGTVLGYNNPFDRHDWIVDRCGEEVRYVIDFYRGQMNDDQKFRGQVGFYLDVRPAVDSFSAIVDRIRHYFRYS